MLLPYIVIVLYVAGRSYQPRQPDAPLLVYERLEPSQRLTHTPNQTTADYVSILQYRAGEIRSSVWHEYTNLTRLDMYICGESVSNRRRWEGRHSAVKNYRYRHNTGTTVSATWNFCLQQKKSSTTQHTSCPVRRLSHLPKQYSQNQNFH